MRAKLNLLLRRAVLRAQRSLWFFQFLDSPPGQDSGGSDLSKLDDSYPSGCECPDSLCDDADEVWSHAHRERRDGRIARNPAQFACRLVYVGRVAPLPNVARLRGNFLSRVSAATTKTLLQCAPKKDFARAQMKDCMRSRTSHILKVIRMCTRARLAGATRNSFSFSLLLTSASRTILRRRLNRAHVE